MAPSAVLDNISAALSSVLPTAAAATGTGAKQQHAVAVLKSSEECIRLESEHSAHK